MTIERWGAFSVIDHTNPSRMAADVLLYDRLVFPVPPKASEEDWEKKKWNPVRRADQLGDLAIREDWTEAHRRDWQRIFERITQDANHEVEADLRYEATRQVLAQGKWNYEKPPGVDKIFVYSAYQSEKETKFSNFSAKDLQDPPPLAQETARMQGLIAARILVPDERDGEESLKRALHLAHEPDFIEARRDFFDWQYDVLSGNMPAEMAVDRLERSIKRYNSFVANSDRSSRIETIVTVTVVAASLAVATASVVPGVFAPLAAFGLAGQQIVTLGGAGIGAVAQLSKEFLGKPNPPGQPQQSEAGAMFHQIESADVWGKRAGVLR